MNSSLKRSVIAVDVGGHNIRSAIVTESGDIVHRLAEPTVPSRSFSGVVSQIKAFVENSLRYADAHGFTHHGIGISIPGYIQHDQKIVTFAPNFKDFRNVSFEKELGRYFTIPIHIENDGNCHALGEWWKGKGAGLKHVISIVLGTGVGGGVIADQRLIRGARGAGGELGHIVVDPNGPVCGCEARGCLEAFVSATALEKKFSCSPHELERKAKQGDPLALLAFEQMGTYLGIAAATLCSIFEPELVVLAGKISNAYDLFLPDMLEELHTRLKNHPARNVRVEKAAYIDDAGLLGAARTAFQ